MLAFRGPESKIGEPRAIRVTLPFVKHVGPSTLTALVAVFFLSLAPAVEYSAAAAEDVCPPYDHAVRVQFKTLTPDPVYNHRLNVAGIRNLFLTRGRAISGAHERALGVTYAEIVFFLEGDTTILPRSGGYCVYLETVGAEFGWRRKEVHIASEYRKGTCEYNAVFDHENQHVSIIKNALSAYAPQVRAELERELSRQLPVFTRNPRTAADQVVEDLYGRMRGVVDRFQQSQASRHAAIDSSSNYGAIADLCPNWDQNLKRFR